MSEESPPGDPPGGPRVLMCALPHRASRLSASVPTDCPQAEPPVYGVRSQRGEPSRVSTPSLSRVESSQTGSAFSSALRRLDQEATGTKPTTLVVATPNAPAAMATPVAPPSPSYPETPRTQHIQDILGEANMGDIKSIFTELVAMLKTLPTGGMLSHLRNMASTWSPRPTPNPPPHQMPSWQVS
ncbi:hypothetical protein CROQUDRAFT_95559 [Cronartium quercuum f. sp. fusiforme G11]|uniref:Uncharacterized protein n=1 Tax=Cronartium quercuum f. sp. fusiforme G11 TaxID=708437 RepID=A0A9P6NH64_9BASI|nr:hypothetical protein CROQUDRAFT_95559 [Cronartium quercuum f. sp. fusiforme G11]